MVINDKEKYIFIHIPKNAGTSITHKLISNGGNIAKQYDTHVPYEYYIKNNPDKKNYYAFSIVRNPWDRLVSMYKFTIKRGWITDNINFNNWVKNFWYTEACKYQLPKKPIQIKPQIDWISIDNKICINDIVKFENLNEDMTKIFKKINIPNYHLTVSNKSRNKDDNYKKYYNQESIDLVYQYYKKDIEIFNYDY